MEEEFRQSKKRRIERRCTFDYISNAEVDPNDPRFQGMNAVHLNETEEGDGCMNVGDYDHLLRQQWSRRIMNEESPYFNAVTKQNFTDAEIADYNRRWAHVNDQHPEWLIADEPTLEEYESYYGENDLARVMWNSWRRRDEALVRGDPHKPLPKDGKWNCMDGDMDAATMEPLPSYKMMQKIDGAVPGNPTLKRCYAHKTIADEIEARGGPIDPFTRERFDPQTGELTSGILRLREAILTGNSKAVLQTLGALEEAEYQDDAKDELIAQMKECGDDGVLKFIMSNSEAVTDKEAGNMIVFVAETYHGLTNRYLPYKFSNIHNDIFVNDRAIAVVKLIQCYEINLAGTEYDKTSNTNIIIRKMFESDHVKDSWKTVVSSFSVPNIGRGLVELMKVYPVTPGRLELATALVPPARSQSGVYLDAPEIVTTAYKNGYTDRSFIETITRGRDNTRIMSELFKIGAENKWTKDQLVFIMRDMMGITDINAESKYLAPFTVLMFVCNNDYINYSAVNLILSMDNIDVNHLSVSNGEEVTALKLAVQNSSTPLVETLLKAGANPNLPKNLITYAKTSEIFNLLVRAGADISTSYAPKADTPADIIVVILENPTTDINNGLPIFSKDAHVVRMLLADDRLTTANALKGKQTPLMHAIENLADGDSWVFPVLEELVASSKVDVDMMTPESPETALMRLIRRTSQPWVCYIASIQMLVKRSNLNIQSMDEWRFTPLMIAILHDHKPMIELLLKTGGIDFTLQDANGKTALQHAEEREFRRNGIYEIILKAVSSQ